MLKFFQDLSISNKLATVFLFLLFMMGVGGSVGLYNAGQLASTSIAARTESGLAL